MTTEEFILEYREKNVRELALQAKRYPDIDVSYALDQIAGWQRARRKLPSWADVEGIVYPPHISLEQCSGEHAASYKAALARRLGEDGDFIDLTGGFGVDFSFMSRGFRHAVYVERQEHLCQIAKHNFKLLGMTNAEIVCSDGAEYLHSIESAGIIYIDPARRDNNGARTYAITDCTPDVLALEQELLRKARFVIVKLSPMLDWHDAVRSFNSLSDNAVKEVHIVSTHGECKELLFVLQQNNRLPLEVHCVNDDIVFCFRADSYGITIPTAREIKDFLYEPNASIMKAGCFGELCSRFGVSAVGRNSHLFVSGLFSADFPGRRFLIKTVTSLNKKELKATLGEIRKANVATRNFPMTVNELRKKLRLEDGGDVYIFATTTEDGKRVLVVCEKA